ncbi:MAG TPA: glycosyltransferase family 4 protein [Kiritimatiellia bacterium]|jgi:glycosyltransferase involved in cell wall biosynthesis|nr:glycosyltransferase family 4 protein [Kiritimatiellia bacterium]HOM58718.1 glycosyltransferase family 4 protein [Kiritimatiellia bacterium]HOR98153.1 glycosyltransferase family 4 protein [Kiritimatiellia bacterium]HPW76042.1 glycosyltransferase family 4 protein [Kiritimatiellia bacterium]HRU20019.1 glycosyltransferase family 4 protein [Kiritimatiellia bacterium]
MSVKVLMLDLVSEWGGAQHSLYDACVSLSRLGVEPVAAVPQGPLFDRLTTAGITVFPVSPLRAHRRGFALFTTAAKLLRAPATVSQILKVVKPDIIHCNSLQAFLAVRGHHAKTPLIWHVRDLKMPVALARDAAKKAARLFAVSEAVDEYLVEILPQKHLGRIRVVRNGIDLQRFGQTCRVEARSRFGLPPDAPIVGMIAHLAPWKRHDAFIRTAARIRARQPDAHFVSVGRDLFGENTRWRTQLNAEVEKERLSECFHWVTDLDQAETILPAFDVLVHPALREPFGRVICEAMASGVPVVAAESGGPATLIRQQVTGVLVRDGDEEGMADAALALLADRVRASQIADAARAFVQEHHAIEQTAEQLLKEYHSLLASETGRYET